MNDTDHLLALDDLAFVEGAYALLLGRAVDPKGLHDCLGRIEGGTPRTQLIQELRDSDEASAFAARRGGAKPGTTGVTIASLLGIGDDPSFVTQAFIALRGSAASADEHLRALQALAGGQPRRKLLADLRRASPARATPSAIADIHALDLEIEGLPEPECCTLDQLLETTDEAFVFLAYRRMLGRDPDRVGRQAYLESLRSGTSRVTVLRRLQASDEGRSQGARLDGLAQAVASPPAIARRFASLVRRAMRRLRAASLPRRIRRAPRRRRPDSCSSRARRRPPAGSPANSRSACRRPCRCHPSRRRPIRPVAAERP
jgi:hypothetical protein